VLGFTCGQKQVVDANGMTCLHLAAITAAKLNLHAKKLRQAANRSHEIAKHIVIKQEALHKAAAAAEEADRSRKTRSPTKLLKGMLENVVGKSNDRSTNSDPIIEAAEKESKDAELKASNMEKKAREATRLMHLHDVSVYSFIIISKRKKEKKRKQLVLFFPSCHLQLL
jgi:hypothetical protein